MFWRQVVSHTMKFFLLHSGGVCDPGDSHENDVILYAKTEGRKEHFVLDTLSYSSYKVPMTTLVPDDLRTPRLRPYPQRACQAGTEASSLCGTPQEIARYFFKWLGNFSTRFYSWHKWKLRFSLEEQITETITQNPNLWRTVTPVPEKAVKGNSNYAASRPRFSTEWVEPHTGNLPDRRRHRHSDYCKPYIFLCSLELFSLLSVYRTGAVSDYLQTSWKSREMLVQGVRVFHTISVCRHHPHSVVSLHTDRSLDTLQS